MPSSSRDNLFLKELICYIYCIFNYHKLNMDSEMIQDSKDGVDSVALALLNALTNENQTSNENCLKAFLMKIYRNNVSSKNKYMNSIRLNRFNAFLYKINNSLPLNQQTNKIILNCILGALSNDRNFVQEEDQQAMISIARWICLFVKKLTENKESQLVLSFLNYVINDSRPALPSTSTFDQHIRNDTYFSMIELTAEDECQAIRNQGYFSITSNLNIKDIIVKQIQIQTIYGILYNEHPEKHQIIALFNKHTLKINLKQELGDLFINTFLLYPPSTSEEFQYILQSIDQNYFDIEVSKKIIQKIVREQQLALYYGIHFKKNCVQQLFLEQLTNYWKKRDIKIIINSFLSCTRVSNSIPLLLIIHSESIVPKEYATLLFQSQKYEKFNHEHLIITLIAIAQNVKQRHSHELIEFYQKNGFKLNAQKKTYFFNILQFTLSKFDLSTFYILLLNNYEPSKMKNKPEFSLIQKLTLDMTSISANYKTSLIQMLQEHTEDGQGMSQIRNELLSFCLHDDKIVEKVRQIKSLLEQPFEQMALYLTPKQIKHDPRFVLALLMSLNNKLKINFIQEPHEKILQPILSLFFKEYNQFGIKMNDYEFSLHKQKDNKSAYYSALFKYNLSIRSNIGCNQGKISQLLNASKPYNRVQNLQISQFLMKEQKNHDSINSLWNNKRMIIQLFTLFKQILNSSDQTNFTLKKEFRAISNPEYKNILAIYVIKSYFQCEIDDINALKKVFHTIPPEYKYFQSIEKNIQSYQDQPFDFLQLIPSLLQTIYPETIKFISKIIESEPIKRQKNKNSKKSTKSKKSDKKSTEQIVQETVGVFQNNQLFEQVIKKNGLQLLFGDSSQFQTFDFLLSIVSKIDDPTNSLQGIINEWLYSIKMFHYTNQTFEAWKIKLMSYCSLWRYILFEKKYQINQKQLERHFLILTEILNALYQKNKECFDVEQKILLTLLIIYQASLRNIDQKSIIQQEKAKLPLQNIKSFFLTSKLEHHNQSNFYYCFTCKHGICQLCAPFLHKNHDINYVGKQGTCVHDSNVKAKVDNKEIQGYNKLDAREILQATSFIQPGMQRGSRRDEDIFLSNYEFPEEDLDYLEHLSKLNDIIGFKEVMERRMIEQRQIRQQRERERQRLREREIQKEFIFARERDRMEREEWSRLGERESRQLREIFQARQPHEFKDLRQQKEERQVSSQNILQIKSQSSKSIKNLHINFFSNNNYEPVFTPAYESHVKYEIEMDMKPLRCLLLREIQLEGNEQANNHQSEINKITIENVTEKYLFFNKSHFFKNNYNRNQYSARGSSANNVIKRTLLTNNGKFLAFPSTHNGGIVLLSIINMINKFQKRLLVKNFSQIQQERTYALTSINNSNLSFQPYQISFSKSNPNMLAIIGSTQIGFGVLSNQGKLQKYMQADFKSSEAIVKFQWLGRQKNIFAVCSGNSIRIGSILDELKVRTMTRFKLGSDRTIRDFEILIENSVFVVYMIDNNSNFYKSQFDIKDIKAINSQKKIEKIEFFGNLQSLIVIDKKIFLSASDGNCYLIRSQIKGSAPHLIKTFDLSSAFKLNESTKFLKPPYYISQMRVLHKSQVTFSLCCILRRANADPKRKGGLLAIMRTNDKNKVEIFIISDDENIQCFDFSQISETNYVISYIDENGSLFMYNYLIPSEILINKDETKVQMTQHTILRCNNLIKEHNLFYLAQYSQPRRYTQFKDSKDITQNYTCSIDNVKQCIQVSVKESFKHFWTGFSFKVQKTSPKIPSELQFDLFGQYYSYSLDASRQIQIPLTIKESLQIFTTEKQFQIYYIAKNTQLKDIKIYGIDFNTESIFKKTYSQIHRIIFTHISYPQESIECFLQNTDRSIISKLNLFQLATVKTNHKYTPKEYNLLLKLQLLRESIQGGFINQKQIEESIKIVKENLLPLCQKRNYLQKSCHKLIKKLSNYAVEGHQKLVGHPYQYRTFLDFYYFQRYYKKWNSTKHFSSFMQLVQHLYSLIFKRIANLYIIFKLYPNLIYELTFYYKNALNSLKIIRMQQKSEQSLINRLINVCPNFIALICEYYQTLKNTTNNTMIDESNQFNRCPEKIILDLLEQVFCATRKELYRQIFISPQMYLQRMYLSPKGQHEISSAINIFQIKSIQNEQVDHASRKASLYQVQQIQKEEELQLQEQSQKQMMEQEEARFMFEQVQIKQNNYEEESNKDDDKMECQPNPNGEIQEQYMKISHILKSYLISRDKVIPFVYHQFSFQIITALFHLNNYLNKQNSVFYMGFFFNLLRIIQANFQAKRDKVYLQNLFKAVLLKLNESSHSIFYMILNYFFQPVYQKKEGDKERKMLASNSRLANEFISYCVEQKVDIYQLVSNYKVNKQAETITLSESMKFKSFQIHNQLYQLHFLANLYFNYIFINQIQTIPSPQFQKAVLSAVVKYKSRSFLNIMIFNGWQTLLEGARVQVGFQTLNQDVESGIKMLYECSKKQPQIFISKLCDSIDLVNRLQSILGKDLVKKEMVIEMLNTYYSN